MLSVALLVWTQREKNTQFFLFLMITVVAGFGVEVLGVNTGLLFGNYNYGTVLGYQWWGVPLIIGVNWFIILYCCGITMSSLFKKILVQTSVTLKTPIPLLKAISVITDGATVAVIFDWLIEPVAIKLGFWHWNDGGAIPLYNYICWVVTSLGLLTVFHFLKFDKQNKFAINLLLIQFMFFLLLRTFLK